MPTLKLPALDPATVAERRGSGYPEPFRSRMGDRVKRRLGDACGLTRFGVNLVMLGPGGQSALRHYHTREDEFVYVLDGEVVLISDAGEQTLRAGDCAGYAAGTPDGHHFVNRSAAPARYLEIGNRDPEDRAFYPDDDLAFTDDGERYVHKDGSPY
ncbi:MAG TPA: cupin domain-containing protein [Casimicrobiaceae bacterium]|nr:cupin domain-containing protein [Casimicrobiaceae bacterium]